MQHQNADRANSAGGRHNDLARTAGNRIGRARGHVVNDRDHRLGLCNLPHHRRGLEGTGRLAARAVDVQDHRCRIGVVQRVTKLGAEALVARHTAVGTDPCTAIHKRTMHLHDGNAVYTGIWHRLPLALRWPTNRELSLCRQRVDLRFRSLPKLLIDGDARLTFNCGAYQRQLFWQDQ